MQSKKPVKRRQISNACIACRKAHRACDSERPCRRCIEKGLECTTVHSQSVDELLGMIPTKMPSDGFVFAETHEIDGTNACGNNYIDSDMAVYDSASPSDPIDENNNLLQYSNNTTNNEFQALALQRIENLENEIHQLRQLLKQAVQPINNTTVPSAAHVKWDLNTQRIIGCNDAFYHVFGMTRADLPIFEQFFINGTSAKVKFILEKLNAGSRLVEVKAIFKQPGTQQEKCYFLQFMRDSADSTVISTNIIEIEHYDDEYRVDDYTQFPTFSRQCFALSVDGAAAPWRCCGEDELTAEDIPI